MQIVDNFFLLKGRKFFLALPKLLFSLDICSKLYYIADNKLNTAKNFYVQFLPAITK